MTYEKKWHDCPCGESIAVSESEFGKVMLAEWRKTHTKHAANVEVGSRDA
ncbi:hypothetical protein ACTU6V_05460 [Microbacterium sp. A204]